MNRKRRTAALCAAAIFALTSVTLSLSKGDAAPAGAPLKITAVISTTGRFATQGVPERQGMMLAQSEINAAGGIGGRPLDITVLDDEGAPDVAAQLATQAVGNGAVALISGVSVATGQAVARVATESKIPLIIMNPDAGTWALKNGTLAKYVFQTPPGNPVEATALISFAKDKLHAKRAALLADENAYGQQGTRIMGDLVPKSGLTLTTSQTYPGTGNDFTPQVLAVKNTNPDVVFVWGAATAPPLIVRAIRQLGIKAEVLGTTGIMTPAFLRVSAKDGEGVYSDSDLNFTHPDPVQRKFIEGYHRMFHETPATFSSFAYDAVYLFANALRRAHGKTDGDAIANAMETTKPLQLSGGTFRMTAKDHNGLSLRDVHIAVDKNEVWFDQ